MPYFPKPLRKYDDSAAKYSKIFAWKLILQNGLYANEIIFILKMEGF